MSKQTGTPLRLGVLGLVGAVSFVISGLVWLLAVPQTAKSIATGLALAGLIAILAYLALNFNALQALLARRSVKYGANAMVMSLLVLGICMMVEAISTRHDFRLDLTTNNRFTLSAQTRKVLDGLGNDIKILAFFNTEQPDRAAFEDLLKQYTNLSSRISYEFIDPDSNPARARQYEIKSYGTAVLETSDRQEKIDISSEEALTNGLIKVTRAGQKTIYALAGHGERGLADVGEKGLNQLQKALENENYAVKELILMQQAAVVPDDAAVLLVAGPQTDLVPAESEALTAYLQKGGQAVFLLDPDQAPGLTAFLKPYGVELGDNMVIDPLSRIFGAGYDMPVASQYEAHPITEDFTSATFFPIARSVQLSAPLPEQVAAQTLLSSSPQSWGETNQAELQQGSVEFTDGSDLQGPVPLAAVVTVKQTPAGVSPAPDDAKPADARLVVFGDSDFASNAYLGLSGNEDLLLNSLSWLAEEEDLIAIRAKNQDTAPLMLTQFQGQLAFLLAMFVLPVSVIAAGVLVFIQRREATR